MNKSTEIAVQYHLPTNWEQEKSFSFDHLSEVVTILHDSAYSATVKAVNRFATVRNYVIGFYIVEYEQHGSDRAKYGDRLLKRLAERVNKRGINETLLKVSRAFYLNYPQIKDYLLGKSATPSHESKYVSYFRENEMQEGDNPPIGILLCTRKGEKMVEYALAGMDNNLFVSTYMLSLPNKETLQNFLLTEINNR